MSAHLFISFWSVSILFVITPGVDWAYVISSGVQERKVLPAVLGLLFGHLIATLLVATGAGALIANYPTLLLMLTTIGAVYLFWIGCNLLIHPAVISINQMVANSSNPPNYWFYKGICVSGLNPKVFLFFLALLPQFIDLTSKWPISLQIILLGLVHIFSCAVVYLIVGHTAQKLLSSRPFAAKVVSQISGLLMILIASFLLITQISSRL